MSEDKISQLKRKAEARGDKVVVNLCTRALGECECPSYPSQAAARDIVSTLIEIEDNFAMRPGPSRPAAKPSSIGVGDNLPLVVEVQARSFASAQVEAELLHQRYGADVSIVWSSCTLVAKINTPSEAKAFASAFGIPAADTY